MDVSAFFKRIDFRGRVEPSERTLCALHRAFVLSVPFENLDIHRNRQIVFDEAAAASCTLESTPAAKRIG